MLYDYPVLLSHCVSLELFIVYVLEYVNVFSVAVCNKPHRCGNSHTIWDHTCYLPSGRGDIPTLTRAEAGTRLSISEGI